MAPTSLCRFWPSAALRNRTGHCALKVLAPSAIIVSVLPVLYAGIDRSGVSSGRLRCVPRLAGPMPLISKRCGSRPRWTGGAAKAAEIQVADEIMLPALALSEGGKATRLPAWWGMLKKALSGCSFELCLYRLDVGTPQTLTATSVSACPQCRLSFEYVP